MRPKLRKRDQNVLQNSPDPLERETILLTEHALRAGGDLFEQLATNAPVAIFVKDLEGRYTLANPLACEALGNTEAVGLRDDQLLDAAAAERIRQHDLEVIESRLAIENEERVQRGDFLQDYLAVKFPLFNSQGEVQGVCGVAVDITARRQAVEELHKTRAESDRQRRLYEAILAATPDLVFVFDLQGRFTFANEAVLQIWGRTWDDAIGKTCRELGYPEWHAAMHQREIELVISTKLPCKGEVPFTGTHGTRVYEYIFVPVLDSSGEVEAIAGSTRDVTDRKEIEERFRSLANNAPVGIFQTNLAGETVFVNEAWCQLAGLDREGAKGDGWIHAVHSDDRQRVIREWQVACGQGLPSHTEFRFRRPDGRIVWLQGNAEPLRDPQDQMLGYIGTVADITSRKLAEQALSENQQRVANELTGMRSLHKLTQCLLATKNLETALEEVLTSIRILQQADFGSIHLYDPLTETFLVAAQHGFEQGFLDSLAKESFAENSACGQALSSGKRVAIEDVTLAPDYASLLPMARQAGYRAIQSTPIKSRSGVLLGILTTHFCQPRKLAPRELWMLDLYAHQAAAFIEQMQLFNSMREADHRKDEFLAMLAHELRNPLAPIRSGLDYLALDTLEENEIVGIMRVQVEHLVRLVDDLLDVSRIARGKVELRKEIVEIAPLVERAVESSGWAFKAKYQSLDVSLANEAIHLYADPVRFVQVLGNLLNNASKYTPEGGHVELTVTQQEGQVTVQVKDNGIGIERELLPSVFDLFTQSTRALDRAQGGMGIGLTLVRSLVELHDGSVSAESEGVGRGSRFAIKLPICQETPVATPKPTHSITPGRRILVVDDNYGAARLVSLLLKKLGDNQIEMAHDGSSALEKIATFNPEIVLLDIGLPGMDGYEVARTIRSATNGNQPFLVALTGYGQPEDLSDSKAAGFDEHLVKPPSVDMLKEMLADPRICDTVTTG